MDVRHDIDPDCATCAHRYERHPSRFKAKRKPRTLDYVCMVTGKAIGEHGTMMRTVFDAEGNHVREPMWAAEVPCKRFDNKRGWVAWDWDPME